MSGSTKVATRPPAGSLVYVPYPAMVKVATAGKAPRPFSANVSVVESKVAWKVKGVSASKAMPLRVESAPKMPLWVRVRTAAWAGEVVPTAVRVSAARVRKRFMVVSPRELGQGGRRRR